MIKVNNEIIVSNIDMYTKHNWKGSTLLYKINDKSDIYSAYTCTPFIIGGKRTARPGTVLIVPTPYCSVIFVGGHNTGKTTLADNYANIAGIPYYSFTDPLSWPGNIKKSEVAKLMSMATYNVSEFLFSMFSLRLSNPAKNFVTESIYRYSELSKFATWYNPIVINVQNHSRYEFRDDGFDHDYYNYPANVVVNNNDYKTTLSRREDAIEFYFG